MRSSTLLIVASVLLWFSCEPSAKDEGDQQGEDHFPVAAYYDSLANHMDSIAVIRVIYKDGKLFDSVEVNNYDVAEDMDVLRKADISANSLLGKYAIERSKEDSVEKLTYKLNPELDEQVKELNIWLENGSPIKIHSDRSFESVIASIHTSTSFNSGKGYEIHSELIDKVSGETVKIDKKIIYKK